MNITVDQLLAKIGQLTMLLEGAQARIAELERVDVHHQQNDHHADGGQQDADGNGTDHRTHGTTSS